MNKKNEYTAELYAHYLVSKNSYALKELKLKVYQETIHIREEPETDENWTSEVKYSVNFVEGSKIIEHVEKKDFENKTTEKIDSKIVFINEKDIYDDVMHVNFILSKEEVNPEKMELPFSISFTTFVDGLQCRINKKPFSELRKGAREKDFEYIARTIDSIVRMLEFFIMTKVNYVKTMREHNMPIDCIRVP